MAEEKKWKKWQGQGKPEGKGGTSIPESSQLEEVEGRGKKVLVTCFNCGSQCYIDSDWTWFTCCYCGITGHF